MKFSNQKNALCKNGGILGLWKITQMREGLARKAWRNVYTTFARQSSQNWKAVNKYNYFHIHFPKYNLTAKGKYRTRKSHSPMWLPSFRRYSPKDSQFQASSGYRESPDLIKQSKTGAAKKTFFHGASTNIKVKYDISIKDRRKKYNLLLSSY